eukprot:gene7196-8921_t
MPSIPSSVAFVRRIAFMEGVSFLLLLGIAMPLKYFAGLPAAVKYVGWAHGLLFILLGGGLVWALMTTTWPMKRAALAHGGNHQGAGNDDPLAVDFGFFNAHGCHQRERDDGKLPALDADVEAEKAHDQG